MAEEEGFKDVDKTFRGVASVESHHERRYRKLLENVERGKVFKKESPIKWNSEIAAMYTKPVRHLRNARSARMREATLKFGVRTARSLANPGLPRILFNTDSFMFLTWKTFCALPRRTTKRV